MGRFVIFAALAVLLAGCGAREVAAPAQPRLTRIDWLGNQCFRITSSLGTSILTNPYAPRTNGRTLPDSLKSDILLITAERPDTNNINTLENQPSTLRGGVGIGFTSLTGVPIRGIPVYRNADAPSMESMNLIYAWTMDGIRFCFTGHAGLALTPDQLSQIGPVDVLFISTDAAQKKEIVNQLKPRAVIPMGASPGSWTVGGVKKINAPRFSMSREMLTPETISLVFSK